MDVPADKHGGAAANYVETGSLLLDKPRTSPANAGGTGAPAEEEGRHGNILELAS